MAYPAASAQGSNTTNAGAVAVNLPAAAPAVGDLAFCVIAHRDNAVGTPTPSDTAGFGPWTQVAGSPVVQGAARLTVWESVVESTSPTPPTVSDSGDHQQHRVFYVSHGDGTPEITATEASTDATSDTSGVATCPDSTVAESLVFLFAAGDTPDLNGTTEYSALANADLGSITERADNSVQTGGGSSKLIASGQKATAGTITDWTYTKANAGVKAHLVVVVSPPSSATTHFGSFSMPVSFGKDVAGFKQTFASFSSPLTFGKDINAFKETFSGFTFPIAFGKDFAGFKEAFGSFSLPVIFGKDIEAFKETFSSFAFPITFSSFIDGEISTGAQDHFGAFSLDLTVDSDIELVRETFSQFSTPLLFEAEVDGQRRTFSSFTLPLNFGSIVTPGPITVHGVIDLDLIVAISTSGIVGLPGVILNDAVALYLGEIEVVAVFVGDEQVW
jgi:hypothetical protein